MGNRVRVEIEAGVADVRLVRADKMNALDDAMFEALVSTGERLKRERGVRAVVVSGEGRAFCAGLDVSSFAGMGQAKPAPAEKAAAGPAGESPAAGRLAARTHGIANRPQYAAWVWREVPVPVIAAVHGVAFGGGFQVILGADLRYLAPGTRLSVMEIKWGLVPDMAGMQLMRHLAREDVVRELTYTGRVFSAEEALGLGFATRLCDDPRAAALETAREIAAKSPDAIRAAKRLMRRAFESDAAPVLLGESEEQDALIGSPNQIEAVMANLQKRTPEFRD